MSKKYIAPIVSLIALALPALAYAATTSTLSTVVTQIIGYLNRALVLMMALAIVFFTWYVIKYYIMPNENRKEGNTYVMYSIIGFFVILSFWGLVNIIQNSFGLGNNSNRPGDWGSFTTLFPGSTSSGGSSSNNSNNLIYGTGCPGGQERDLRTGLCPS